MADPFDLDDFDDAPAPAGGQRPLSTQAAAAARPDPSPLLEGLNPEQRQAVLHTEGPLLVLAGAGTGKTRVLTTRLAWILAGGMAWPGQILAVTFTNKAAREMKERIGRLIGGMVEGMTWLGTFHSIGVKILQRHAELADLKSGFSILDTDDQLRLLKQVMEAEGIDEKRHPARQMAGLIDDWKNRGLAPDDLPETEAGAFAGGRAGTVYASYQQRLKEINAVDFGDLLLEPLRLLRANPDLLEEYRRKFRYMLVDEYQDTNVAQYMLLRLLAGKDGNICCVGDDDQSIYGWRGAQVENILRFERDFPGARIIRLERNYRSTAHILAAASHLISHNRGRLGKTLHSQIGDGEKVVLRAHWDDAEEARAIADDLEAMRHAGGRLSDVAVLVRATFQMRALEERFIEIGLPYRVIGGPRFYERMEVRDALAYLRVIHSPDHDLAFERIINVPKRGIGATSVKRMHEFARMRGLSLFRAAELMLPDLPARARNSLKALLADFARWRALVDTVPPSELAETVLDESGYAAMWKSDKSPKAQGRLENLKELVRSMEEFDTLAGFLEHVSLVMAADEAADGDRVSIMTMHAAKGLEFDTVFLPGWEEGLFPHQRALDETGEAGLEEERRLAYVAITRAKRRAIISFAHNRRVHNLWQSALPSRFIDELPPEHVEVLREDAGPSGFSPSPVHERSGFAGYGGARDPGTGPVIEARAEPRRAEPCPYEIGQRIFHQKFGYGIITGMEGDRLTIEFEHTGTKRIMAGFVQAA